MRCVSPIDAFQRVATGDVYFGAERQDSRPLQLRCGQCIHCKLERSRQWALRQMCEVQMHDRNSFITLTFDEKKVKDRKLLFSLDYREFQLFLKRARKELGPFRYFVAGEYGETFLRPHFHANLFGIGFDDLEFLRTSSAGFKLYTSSCLERLWPFGYSSVADVTFESAAYVARYCVKKITGPMAEDHYIAMDSETGEFFRKTPEFCRMSLGREAGNGLGLPWLHKYKSSVYREDGTAFMWQRGGVKMRPPKAFDRYLEDKFPLEFDDVQFQRYKKGLTLREDSTPERLASQELCTRARLSFKKRSLL